MKALLEIEILLGRIRTEKWGNRTIDLDLIFCRRAGGDIEIFQSDILTLPHPEMHCRSFVLEPAAEIAGDWLHPILKKNIRELWTEMKIPRT
jgi:2-amino-4-hydroxy-6-hydroxymethyldihydropteridine diphosphokinase